MKLLYPYLCCLVIICFLNKAYAQREADNWYFGNHAGLNFYNSIPRALQDSPMESFTSSAIVSDKISGQLLFLSNGDTVWNRNFQVMPHGTGLFGNSAISQSVLIVPMPGKDSIYYLFTLAGPEYDSRDVPINLYYSIIDMRLDGGKGDVVQSFKNILLLEGLRQKLTAIPHISQDAYWLLTHQENSDQFNIQLIDRDGFSEATAQAIGPTLHKQAYFSYGNGNDGCLKASPDGSMVAYANFINTPAFDTVSTFELFDFNAATGMLSNHRNLGSNYLWTYGVSFSPDNSKLYLSGVILSDFEQTFLHQFDLTTPNIKASRIGFSSDQYWLQAGGSLLIPALELAPDGKIYYTSDQYSDNEKHINYLYHINYPNHKGDLIDIKYQQIDYGEGNYTLPGLPNFMQHYFKEENIRRPGSSEAAPCSSEVSIKLYPNPTQDYITFNIREECLSSYTLSIHTITGQELVRYQTTTAPVTTVNVSTLASGTYIAELVFADRVLFKKFIIE